MDSTKNGVIVLDEKERWALYFSEYLRSCGYANAAKVLRKVAVGPDFIIKEVSAEIDFTTPEFINALNLAYDDREKQKQLAKKAFKPSLMEDMHEADESA